MVGTMYIIPMTKDGGGTVALILKVDTLISYPYSRGISGSVLSS
jgi:hypothetical protein